MWFSGEPQRRENTAIDPIQVSNFHQTWKSLDTTHRGCLGAISAAFYYAHIWKAHDLRYVRIITNFVGYWASHMRQVNSPAGGFDWSHFILKSSVGLGLSTRPQIHPLYYPRMVRPYCAWRWHTLYGLHWNKQENLEFPNNWCRW